MPSPAFRLETNVTADDDTSSGAGSSAGTLRSVSIACSPDTSGVAALVDLVASPEVKVRDGDRWTAYAASDLTLALAGPSEIPAGAAVSLNIKVTDVSAVRAALLAAGAKACGDLVTGDHEVRAAVWLTDAVVLTAYQPI